LPIIAASNRSKKANESCHPSYDNGYCGAFFNSIQGLQDNRRVRSEVLLFGSLIVP